MAKSNTLSMLQWFNEDLQKRNELIKKEMTRLDVGCKSGNIRLAFESLKNLQSEAHSLQIELATYQDAALKALQTEVQENAQAQYNQAAEAMDNARQTLNRFVVY